MSGRDGGSAELSAVTSSVRLVGQIEVILRIRRKPDDGQDVSNMEVREVVGAADSYFEALAAAKAQVPGGWQLLSIGRW